MNASRKLQIALNWIGIALLLLCLGLIGILVPFGGFPGNWIATNTDLIQVVTALLGVTALIASLLSYLRRRKLRAGDFPFAVVEPYKHDDVLPKIFRITDINNPLTEPHVPYLTGREGSARVQNNMRELLRAKQALIVQGPSGVGKTREAHHSC
jgi:hypothetical protein